MSYLSAATAMPKLARRWWPNAKVTGEIVGQARAKKIIVFKKKRRKSYSRQRGHRQYQTALKITAIETYNWGVDDGA